MKISASLADEVLTALKAKINAAAKSERDAGHKVSASSMWNVTHVAIKYSDGKIAYFAAPLLDKFAKAAVANGLEGKLYSDTMAPEARAVSARGEDGFALLMPRRLDNVYTYATTEENLLLSNGPWAYDAQARVPSEAEKAEAFATGKDVSEIRMSTAAPAMSPAMQERVDSRIDQWEKVVGSNLHLVRSIDDMPEALRDDAQKRFEAGLRDRGMFYNGEAYALVYGLRTPHEVDQVAMHELVAHKGLRGLFDSKEKLDKFTDDVWNMMDNNSRQWGIRYVLQSHGKAATPTAIADAMNNTTFQREAADEYMAHLAEITTVKNQDSVVERIIDALHNALRTMGIELQYNNRELRDLIRESYSNTTEGINSQVPSGNDVMFSFTDDNLTGFKIEHADIEKVLERMETAAVPVEDVPYTIEEWSKRLGGIIHTPVGDLSMGKHQFGKLRPDGNSQGQDRRGWIGLIDATIHNPLMIVTQNESGDYQRQNKLVFAKTFENKDKQKEGIKDSIFFVSISVLKDTHEAVITNHIKPREDFAKIMENGVVVFSSISMSGIQTEAVQRQLSGTTKLSSNGIVGVEDKDINSSKDSQKEMRFSTANENESIFISNAEQAVEAINQGKATPDEEGNGQIDNFVRQSHQPQLCSQTKFASMVISLS